MYQHFIDEDEEKRDNEIEMDTIRGVNDKLTSLDQNMTWKSNPLKIIQKITIFLTNIKHTSPTYRFKLLRRNIFSLIRDQASVFNYYLNNGMLRQKPNKFERLKYRLSQSKNCIWRFWQFIKDDGTVLQPADGILLAWDMMLMVLTILNIVYVPLTLSFNIEHHEMGSISLLFSTIPSCVFLIDLLLSFFKGYYHRGILHTSKSDIFWHYLKGDFMLDMAVVFPFILSWFGVVFANYLMLIRITRVRTKLEHFEEIANFQERSATIYRLFCLIYSMLMITHFCACIFHYLGRWEIENGYSYTWLHAQKVEHATNFDKYVNALYWTSITSMTVGYGDIVPVTIPEKILVIIITFFVTGVFGYALGMIQSIFSKMAEQQDINNSKLRLVTHHIRKRGLTPQLQFRVRKYIEYYLQFKQEEEMDIDELIGQLNPKLKQEVQIEMYYKYLTQSKIVKQYISKPLLRRLCLDIHERTFAPEEEIIMKGQTPDKIYIVLAGHVHSHFKESQIIKSYRHGSILCQREFFQQEQMQFDLKASSFVQVAYIPYEKFIEVTKKDKANYEHYRDVLDQTVFEDNHNTIICEACQATHTFKNCPLVFCSTNKDKILHTLRSTKEQLRKQVRRRKKTQFSLQQVRDAAFKQLMQISSPDRENYQNFDQGGGYHNAQESPNNLFDQPLQSTHNLQYRRMNTNNLMISLHNIPMPELQFDCVYEFPNYYPDFNISKVVKLVNKRTLIQRILDSLKGHDNKFAKIISKGILKKLV